jgi:hypothetical protein|nr:MAG TPA: hypothetical protein [Caudoviricetes sp.]
MERLTNKREADAQREEYERRLANGYPRNIPEERFLRLAAYEDTGLEPEAVETVKLALAAKHLVDLETLNNTPISRLVELAEADKDGRVVVLPCKVGERWTDEDGRAVRITAVIVSIEPFGTNINIYFDYEDATPDDAGSDCVTNWDYFSRHYTCIEVERAMEEKRNG